MPFVHQQWAFHHYVFLVRCLPIFFLAYVHRKSILVIQLPRKFGLFCGAGKISVFTMPLKELSETLGANTNVSEYKPHSYGHVSKILARSRDDCKLISAGTDGNIFLMTLNQNLYKQNDRPHEMDVRISLCFQYN